MFDSGSVDPLATQQSRMLYNQGYRSILVEQQIQVAKPIHEHIAEYTEEDLLNGVVVSIAKQEISV